jgi:hypothetical protein
MPTSKTKRHEYAHMYEHVLSHVVDKEDTKKDNHGKTLFKCRCPVCSSDRGYLRKSQALVPCKRCGQRGKISPLKGKSRSPDFSEKIAQANANYRKRKNPSWSKLSPEAKKIAHNIRSRIFQVINKKNIKSELLIGLPWQELKQYLESKFQPGMSWDNYGSKGWHIDHIRPLSSFNLLDPEQFRQACHYTNLQPLWWFDNLSKSDKYER